MPKIVAFAALALLTILLQFGFLSSGSLRTWDEALTAERSREMLVTGDWLTPHLNFETDFNKPPLYYWLTAPLEAISADREWPPRFWSAAFACGCILFTALLAAGESRDPRAAFAAGALLLLNAAWVNKTREALLDSGMIFGALGALYFLTAGRHIRHAWLWAGVIAAIGCMVKGPYPLLAWPCAFVAERGIGYRVWSMEKRRPVRIEPKLFLMSFLLLIVLVAPWYIIQCVRYGWAFPQRAFGYAIVERFSAPIEGHTGGPLFYLQTWWQQSASSLILLCGALIIIEVRVFRKAPIPYTPYPIPSVLLWLLTAITMVLAGSKREAYLVYLLPIAALITGRELAHLSKTLGNKTFILLPSSFILSFLLLPSAFCLTRDYDRRLAHSDGSKKIAEEIIARKIAVESLTVINAPRHAILYYLSGKTPLIVGNSLDGVNIGGYAVVGKDAHGPEAETIVETRELALVRVLKH